MNNPFEAPESITIPDPANKKEMDAYEKKMQEERRRMRKGLVPVGKNDVV